VRPPSAQHDRQQEQVRIHKHGQIRAQARHAEKHRHEQTRDQAAQALVDLPRKYWRFADQDAGDERAEHGVNPDQVRDHRHRAHQEQDDGDHRG
jgi:hypothetical protein